MTRKVHEASRSDMSAEQSAFLGGVRAALRGAKASANPYRAKDLRAAWERGRLHGVRVVAAGVRPLDTARRVG